MPRYSATHSRACARASSARPPPYTSACARAWTAHAVTADDRRAPGTLSAASAAGTASA